MSKVVDKSDLSALEEDDIRYLQDRGLLTPAEEAEHGVIKVTRLGGGADEASELGENTGDVGTVTDESFGGVGHRAEPIPVPQALVLDEDGEAADNSALADTPYEEWPKSNLVAEVDVRNSQPDRETKLRRSGTVADLAAVLREDDEA